MSSEKPASNINEKAGTRGRIKYRLRSANILHIQVQTRVKMNRQGGVDGTFISQCAVDNGFKGKNDKELVHRVKPFNGLFQSASFLAGNVGNMRREQVCLP